MTHVAAGAAPSAAPEHRDSADPLPTVARRASRLEHAWWGAIVTGTLLMTCLGLAALVYVVPAALQELSRGRKLAAIGTRSTRVSVFCKASVASSNVAYNDTAGQSRPSCKV